MKNITTKYPLLNFILLNHKINIIIATVSLLSTLVYVFLIADKMYTSEISALPPTANFTSGLAGKLGDLTQLAGINLGSQTAQSPELFMGILKSRRLLEKTIYKEYKVKIDDEEFTGNFIKWHDIDGDSEREILEKALKEIREDVMFIEIDDDNAILYLSITTINPNLSALIANYMAEQLNLIVKQEVQKEYRQQLEYLQIKVQDSKDSLHVSEMILKEFLETHFDLTIPEYQFTNLRLQRNIRINTEIYIEFRKQLEIFIMENMINLSDIKILDEAYPPYKKSRPKRILMVISIFLLAIFVQTAINASFIVFNNVFEQDSSKI